MGSCTELVGHTLFDNQDSTLEVFEGQSASCLHVVHPGGDVAAWLEDPTNTDPNPFRATDESCPACGKMFGTYSATRGRNGFFSGLVVCASEEDTVAADENHRQAAVKLVRHGRSQSLEIRATCVVVCT